MSAGNRLGLESNGDRDLRNDLNWSIAEIQDLRRRVEKSETKAKAFDALVKITELIPTGNGEGMHVDIVWRLQERIDALNEKAEVEATQDIFQARAKAVQQEV